MKTPILILSWVSRDGGRVTPYACTWSHSLADLMSGHAAALGLDCGRLDVLTDSPKITLRQFREDALARACDDFTALRGLASSAR